MKQKRSYKQYPKEFKEEAVALVREQGYSVPEVAESGQLKPDTKFYTNALSLLVE
ncbi:transposase [Agaribacterium haliotis]|uniref:transposase n=1 Tax=Agaribacterium haliotis TaxID=2013869 RepID=UPI00117740ED|nr:transposase [Agaribacterium haliotis]